MNHYDAPPMIPHWVRTLDGIAFTDIPTRPSQNLPSFVIIGAQKAGTTALNKYLSQHPHIFMCPIKEPQFFSTDVIYERGLAWYQGLFADAGAGQICGEASVSYTFFPSTPLTPQRIQGALGNIKLIYMVREPVSRIRSACLQTIKYQRYVLDDPHYNYGFDDLIQLGEDPHNPLGLQSFIQSSQYITQIEQYLKVFKPEQLLVICQEDLATQPDQTLKKIFEFIGVDPHRFPAFAMPIQENISADIIQSLKGEKLGRTLQVIPGYDQLKNLIPDRLKEPLKNLGQKVIADDQVVSLMSETTNARLKEYFKPYNQALAEFLNRDLSHWD